MFCTKCGYNNVNDVNYCQNCGTPINVYVKQNQAYHINSSVNMSTVNSYTNNPVVVLLKKLGSSPSYLVAIIAFSLALLMKLIETVTGGIGLLSDIYSLTNTFSIPLPYEFYNTINYYFSIVKVLSIVIMIPSMLQCLGMWLVFGSAKSQISPVKPTGLIIIKVITIINLVYACLLCVGTVTTFIIIAVNSFFDEIILAMIGLAVLSAGIFSLVILYYAKIVKTINTIKCSIYTSQPSYKVSMYVAVILFIAGSVNSISLMFQLISGWIGAVTIIEKMCTIVSTFAFGVFICAYRNKMKMHIINNNYNQPIVSQPVSSSHYGYITNTVQQQEE